MPAKNTRATIATTGRLASLSRPTASPSLSRPIASHPAPMLQRQSTSKIAKPTATTVPQPPVEVVRLLPKTQRLFQSDKSHQSNEHRDKTFFLLSYSTPAAPVIRLKSDAGKSTVDKLKLSMKLPYVLANIIERLIDSASGNTDPIESDIISV